MSPVEVWGPHGAPNAMQRQCREQGVPEPLEASSGPQGSLHPNQQREAFTVMPRPQHPRAAPQTQDARGA